MADLHNVFISHYSGDVQQTRELQERLAENGCIVRNSAAKEDEGGIIRNKKGKQVSDAVIARYLKMRINWAGTFIVIIGEHTHEGRPRQLRRHHLADSARRGRGSRLRR